ncbi:MAG TPA: FAD-dependent oxidoreductase [Vicinamibacterales bacterium]
MSVPLPYGKTARPADAAAPGSRIAVVGAGPAGLAAAHDLALLGYGVTVFLSVGVSKGRDIQVPGMELDGVVKAVDYLLNVNRGYRADLGRRVVVVGGGFVAFDAAPTALRLGVEEQVDALSEIAAESASHAKEALDSARAALRGGAREVTIVSLESFGEMLVLRTTQGHEEIRGGEEGGHPVRSPPRAEALRRPGPAARDRASGRHIGLRRGRAIRACL